MDKASLNQADQGQWELAGRLDFASVVEIWPQLQGLVAEGGALTLSLAGVSQTNSAGLVLLLEAYDVASRSGCNLRITELPAAMLDLARLSRCEGFIAEVA